MVHCKQFVYAVLHRYGDIVPKNATETWYATFVVALGGVLKPAVVGGLASLMLEKRGPAMQVRNNNNRFIIAFHSSR